MKYVLGAIGVFFIAYCIVDFKKRPNDDAFNRYYNSKYYRLVILLVLSVIALIISIFTNKN